MSRLHEPPTRIIASIPRRTTGETIRVALLGEAPTHCDVRVFGATRRSKGEPRPTQAGVCVRLDQLPDLIEALHKAEEAAR